MPHRVQSGKEFLGYRADLREPETEPDQEGIVDLNAFASDAPRKTASPAGKRAMNFGVVLGRIDDVIAG